METGKNCKYEKMLKFTQFCNLKKVLEKSAFKNILAF